MPIPTLRLPGDEWKGSNAEFYKLYADWCREYEIHPKTAVAFGREMTPFVMKKWVEQYKSHGTHGKTIKMKTIKFWGQDGAG
jgi:hypothetical protein